MIHFWHSTRTFLKVKVVKQWKDFPLFSLTWPLIKSQTVAVKTAAVQHTVHKVAEKDNLTNFAFSSFHPTNSSPSFSLTPTTFRSSCITVKNFKIVFLYTSILVAPTSARFPQNCPSSQCVQTISICFPELISKSCLFICNAFTSKTFNIVKDSTNLLITFKQKQNRQVNVNFVLFNDIVIVHEGKWTFTQVIVLLFCIKQKKIL